MIVQARTRVQRFAPRVAENSARSAADFIDRFQAVRRESRQRHEYLFLAFPSQLLQDFVGIWLEPNFAPEKRLKGLRPGAAWPAEPLNERPRGALHVGGIRIAGLGIPLR